MFSSGTSNRNRSSRSAGNNPSSSRNQQGFMLVPLRSGTEAGNNNTSNSGGSGSTRFRRSGGSGSGGGGSDSSDSDSDYDPNMDYDTRIPLDADEDTSADIQASRGTETPANNGPSGTGTGSVEPGSASAPVVTADINDTGGQGGQQEQLRRQQIIRLGLIMCFFFFLLDGGSGGGSGGFGGNSNVPPPVVHDEIQLPPQETADIISLMNPLRSTRFALERQNITGEFRGYWRDAVIDGHTRQDKHNSSVKGGSILVQTKTIPIKGVPDMSFVYGSIKFYNDQTRPLLDWNKPLQGIAINSIQKMFLFPTAYWSQQLYVELSSIIPSSSTISPTASPTSNPTTTAAAMTQVQDKKLIATKTSTNEELESWRTLKHAKLIGQQQQLHQQSPISTDRAVVGSGEDHILRGGSHSHGHPHSGAHIHGRNNHQVPTEGNDLLSAPRALTVSSTSTATDLTIHETDTGALLITLQSSDSPHDRFYMKVFVWDTVYGLLPYNLSSPSTLAPALPNITALGNSGAVANNDRVLLRYFPLGEQALSKKFRDIQKYRDDDPNNPELKRRVGSKKGKTSTLNKEITRGPNGIVKDCMRVLEIDFSNSGNKLLNIEDMFITPKTTTTTTFSPINAPTPGTDGNKAEGLSTILQPQEGDNTGSSTVVDRNTDNDATDLHNVKPIASMTGRMVSCDGCRYRDSDNDLILHDNPTIKDIYLTAVSYTFPQKMIENKTLIYSLIVVILCLVQVLSVIYQLKFATTQALNAKNSILTVFAQSLLDALICMTHLLLGAAFPDLFFTEFIWISILKLLLFSVFQMRLVINIYQAIYAQEIAAEGWRGFRNRLVQLHLRFYGVVLMVLLFGTSMWFLTHPFIVILTLYSFWWPQIVHSVMTGTRSALHLYYILGMSATRLFLPLYLLACPVNFPAILVEYLSPGYEIDMKDHFMHGFEGNAGGTRGSYYGAAVFFVAWMGLQVVIVLAQQHLGSRFFVPKQFLPKRYDYHRTLPQSLHPRYPQAAAVASSHGENSLHGDVETGSLLTNNHEDNSHNHDNNEGGLECVICYNPIHLNVSREYMITPCDHLFHEQCLTQWMRVKLECPVCRSVLPTNEEEES